MGGDQSGHANSTPKGPVQLVDLNSEPSCCEVIYIRYLKSEIASMFFKMSSLHLLVVLMKFMHSFHLDLALNLVFLFFAGSLTSIKFTSTNQPTLQHSPTNSLVASSLKIDFLPLISECCFSLRNHVGMSQLS